MFIQEHIDAALSSDSQAQKDCFGMRKYILFIKFPKISILRASP